MDGSRFDNFVRDLALRRTRREALKSFVGAVAGVASSATIASQIDAKQKPKKCKYQGTAARPTSTVAR